ncbi:MAG TPA: TM2 domain-containing protein [Gemmatimonadales bacterium]|nr:TM2 domain-containing protein [Gemmatimonadales bacterium]
MPSEPSDKSRTVALTLAVLLGPFGAHRFYAGRTESAVLMACTLGGLGIWWVYDVIVVGFGQFRDERNRIISNWEPRVDERDALPEGVADELSALRAEVAELAERVDFAERLLASRAPDEPRRIDPS